MKLGKNVNVQGLFFHIQTLSFYKQNKNGDLLIMHISVVRSSSFLRIL